MKVKIILILVVGILIGAVATYLIVPKTTKTERVSQEGETQLYSCGMHPEVISEEPGDCPICGMKLTPIKSSAQAGEVGAERKILYWRAPMDPTEIYDKPGKSKMGMDLVPVYEGDEAGGAGSFVIDGSVQQNMNLRLAKVEFREIQTVIRAYGRVTYAQDKEFSINTKINGWVERLYVSTTGQRVRNGEPLLEIYSPELVSTQEEYLLALSNYEKLQSSPYESVRGNAKRMLSLAVDRLEYWDIPADEIEKLEATGKARRTILLRSQVSGVVIHKGVFEGDKVGPGMDLFHVADLTKIWVEASVYESELALLKEGQKAELELDHILGQKIEGKVDFIYPYIDQKSRANNVRLVFDNPDSSLKPDMYATVRIHSPVAEHTMAIPTEAIIHSGQRNIVFVTKGDGKFEPREVKAGAESDDGFTQILSGLFEDEMVVVSGQFLLDSESQTREAIAKMRAAQAQKPMEASQEAVEHTHEYPAQPEVERASVEHVHEIQDSMSFQIDPNKLYACPMHPAFITTDPEARCPECGMKLVKVAEMKDKVDLENAEFYTCPMHPEFNTTDPDGRCPECGMKLEKVKK
jgi:RND family efflux transporter MFP subunit